MGPDSRSERPELGSERPDLRSERPFLVTTKNAFLPIKRIYSVNTYEFLQSHEGVSEVSEPVTGASE